MDELMGTIVWFDTRKFQISKEENKRENNNFVQCRKDSTITPNDENYEFVTFNDNNVSIKKFGAMSESEKGQIFFCLLEGEHKKLYEQNKTKYENK